MGKKKRRKEKKARDDFSDSDASDTESDVSGSVMSLSLDVPGNAMDHSYEVQISDQIEALREKRASTREAALGGLVRTLRQNYAADAVARSKLTLLSHLGTPVRKGGESEFAKACMLFSLVFVTAGPDEELMDDSAVGLLRAALGKGGMGKRAAAVSALGVATLVAGEAEHTAELLQSVEERMGKVNEESNAAYAVALLDTWGLLVSTQPRRRTVAGAEAALRLHAPLMQHPSVDVRCGCGENVALVYEAVWAAREAGGDVELDAELEEEIGEHVGMLANDSSRWRNKKERSAQRSMFRDIVDTMETGSAPQDDVKLKGATLHVQSWADQKRLQALRNVLADGFHVHLAANPLLSQMFTVELSARASKLSQTEKRMLMSPNSPHAKARTIALDKDRSRAKAAKGGFLQGDE